MLVAILGLNSVRLPVNPRNPYAALRCGSLLAPHFITALGDTMPFPPPSRRGRPVLARSASAARLAYRSHSLVGGSGRRTAQSSLRLGSVRMSAMPDTFRTSAPRIVSPTTSSMGRGGKGQRVGSGVKGGGGKTRITTNRLTGSLRSRLFGEYPDRPSSERTNVHLRSRTSPRTAAGGWSTSQLASGHKPAIPARSRANARDYSRSAQERPSTQVAVQLASPHHCYLWDTSYFDLVY